MKGRVLLTGANGFIGRHVLPHLVSRGFEVHAVTRSGASSFREEVITHTVDLHEESERIRLFAETRPTHILHCAWYVEHGRFWSSPENVCWVETSLALLRCAPAGVRWVGVGTCAEYSWAGDGICREDETPLEPETLYGTAKHSLRVLQEAASREKNISFAWGRIFHLYGPGEPAARFVPLVIRGLLQGKDIPLSHGLQIRDWLYIDDVAGALAALLDSPMEGAVNICSGAGRTLRDVATTVAELLGSDTALLRFGAMPAPPREPAQLIGDNGRLSAIGFQPKWTLVEGLQETCTRWRRL